MNFLDDIDEDLFEVRQRSISQIESYHAQICEPKWFFNSFTDIEKISFISKYKADYFFLNRNYKIAIENYKASLENISDRNNSFKRECIEGIALSFLKLKDYNSAISYARDLQELASTIDTFTVSYDLLFQVNMLNKNYKDAILFAQKIVKLQQFNGDVWLKLAHAYAGITGHSLNFLPNFSFFDNSIESINQCCKDPTSNIDYKELIAACLFHCRNNLRAVQYTAIGFVKDNNLNVQKLITNELENFPLNPNELACIREKVRMIYVNKDEISDQHHEFVDRASSQFPKSQLIEEPDSDKNFVERFLFYSRPIVD